MFWALAVILLAFAGFTVLVLARRRPTGVRDPRFDMDQLKGFVYVGAGALAGLAVAVVIVGRWRRRKRHRRGARRPGLLRLRALSVAPRAVVLFVAAPGTLIVPSGRTGGGTASPVATASPPSLRRPAALQQSHLTALRPVR